MQQHAALKCVPHLLENLNSVASRTSGPIKIVDYGCSEGKNSMIYFNTLLRLFRQSSNSEVFIIHTDLPDNGWGILHNLLNTSEESYLKLLNTFYSTIGRSFYHQLLPNNSVHLGFSAFAFHYLSRKAIRKQNDAGIFHKALKEQGRIDINTILTHRINELVPGGFLTILASASDETETANFVKTVILGSFVQLVEKGVMAAEILNNFELSVNPMGYDEWTEALKKFDDRIEIIKIEIVQHDSPHYLSFLEDNDFTKFREDTVKSLGVLGRPLLLSMLANTGEDVEFIFQGFLVELRNIITEPVNYKRRVAIVTIRKFS